MRIIVDQDEVLAHWVSRIIEWYNRDHGTSHVRDDIKEYFAMEKVLGLNGKDYIKSCLKIDSLYGMLDEIQGASVGLKQLVDAGHDVIIATALPPDCGYGYNGKIDWIRRVIPWFDLKNFVAIQRKYLLQGDVLVDDAPHNVEAWVATGREVILFDAPWNRHLDDSKYLRAKDWNEVVRIVELLEKAASK